MRKHLALMVALVFVIGISVGCSKGTSDEQIQKDIQSKAAADPETKDSDVAVVSKEKKVTLRGTVKTPAAQLRLEQIAREEPSVGGIDDQTSIVADTTQAVQAPPPPLPPPPPPPVEQPKPQPLIVPAGTALTVRVGQALGSKTSQTGQTFLATVAQPVSVGGRTAIPAGATVSGTVVNAKPKGRFKGEGQLSLALRSIAVKGKTYSIQTRALDSTVKGKGKRTAATTGGGAAGGALIGGIAGGGKGAGIGALVGAGAGLVGGAITGNTQVEIPAESALTFQLTAPLTLPPGQ